MNRWLSSVIMLLGAALLLWYGLREGSAARIVAAVIALALAWWAAPVRGRGGPSHADVIDRPAGYPVVIYWRPGCPFCMRLRLALVRTRGLTWINIWADEDATAFVRSVNGGNETVPTVVIDGVPHTNPDPKVVRAAVSEAAPELR